jgi:4-diphosphocytidyl-2-C-methyl-D-erythritol kinase
MICFPNAKINLGLHVINKRADGYHTIETVFYPIKFFDMLEIVQTKGKGQKEKGESLFFDGENIKVDFFSDGIPIDGNLEDNLVYKAYQILDKDFDLSPIKCFLYKKIPMGAGLGGGSSDAAFAIKLLNDIFTLNLSVVQMKNYASQLGSDCAFFIENKPAYVFGRGNELEDFEIDLSKYYLVLLYPNIHSSTSIAYKNVLKRGSFDESQSLQYLLKQPIKNWKNTIENDFEKSVFEIIPSLQKIKQQLYDCGALYASMSGSGSAMFGIFDTKPQLTDELKKLLVFEGKM